MGVPTLEVDCLASHSKEAENLVESEAFDWSRDKNHAL